MAKSKLRKKFLQTRSESDKKAYNKQRNKCIIKENQKSILFESERKRHSK